MCPRLQTPNHSKFTLFQKTNEGNPAAGPGPAADTQHRPLQASRCSFMSALPSMNLRIFPNISPAPYPPVRLKSEPRIPPIRSHRFHYSSPRPLLSTRAATEPKKKWPPPTLAPSPFLLPSCSSKAKPCQNPFVALIEDCHVNCVHRHSLLLSKVLPADPKKYQVITSATFCKDKNTVLRNIKSPQDKLSNITDTNMRLK